MSWAEYDAYVDGYIEGVEYDLQQLRTHAYLVSVNSGLDRKGRKALSPKKMLPLDSDKPDEPEISREELDKWWKFFGRKTIKKKVLNGTNSGSHS